MQPQRREVRVENDEYVHGTRAAPSEANKARGCLGKPPYLRVLCDLKTRSHSRAHSFNGPT